MERIHCRPHRQDRVEVVALPLHTPLVKVAAGLCGDQSYLQEDADTFYRRVLGRSCCGDDGVVTGVAGMCSPILNQQQIGVDHKCGGREFQQEHLIGQSKKTFRCL